MPDMFDNDGAETGQPVAPITEADTVAALDRMARLTHLAEQGETAARHLGSLCGAFVVGMLAHQVPEMLAEEMAHHYLDRLLPHRPAE
jgi:hypothetical protein